jgi:hypothetical protein
MELVLKDLPSEYERKIKAIHILSEGKANLNELLSNAIRVALDGALLTHCNVAMPQPQVIHVPFVQTHDPNPNRDVFSKTEVTCATGLPTAGNDVPRYTTSIEDDRYASVLRAHNEAASHAEDELFAPPQPASLQQQLGISDDTYEGLGDEADFEEPIDELPEEVPPPPPALKVEKPKAKSKAPVVKHKLPAPPPVAKPVTMGPEPEADEDDALFSRSEENGPADEEFDDLTSVPEDFDDDDSLYAEASASYTPARVPAPQAKAASAAGPKAEDFGLKDLGSDASSMGFFEAQLGGGDLPAYARADRRGAAQPMDGARRPASLPSGEDVGPSSMGRRPRVKVSGAK